MTSMPGPSGADDTVKLQTFFNSVPQNTTVPLLKDVSYRLDGTLTFNGRNLTLVGSNTRFVGHGTGTRNRSQFRMLGGNMRMEGISVKGANPNGGLGDNAYVVTLEAQHCVELAGVQSFTLESCPLTEPYGDCVYLSSSPNRCVRLLNSPMSFTGRMGVTICGVNALLIDGCTISDVRRSIFDREPTTATTVTSGVTIRNSHFGAHRLNFLSASGGIGGSPCDDWSIENNTSTSPFSVTYADPGGLRRKNFSFTGNVTTGPGFGGPSGCLMHFTHVDGVTLEQNTLPLEAGRGMVVAKFTDCTGIIQK